MKFYEFVDKAPKIGKLVVVEGVERLFAERALTLLVERLMPEAERALNVDRFVATEISSFGAVESAVAAFPFLGTTRVVVVRGAHDLRVDPRRALAKIGERVPDGNVLVIEDLVSPASKRPEPLAKIFGRAAMRIDTSPTAEVRERFIRETLAELGASAEPAALQALAGGQADLAGTRTDLEKLVLSSEKITLDDVLRESIVANDVRAYRFASAAVAGKAAEALGMAHEMFASDRGAGVPLLAALAAEYGLVWEVARPGGSLPSKARWRERELRGLAKLLGERRARLGFERAVRGFEAVVTGRADDARIVVDIATAAGARETR